MAHESDAVTPPINLVEDLMVLLIRLGSYSMTQSRLQLFVQILYVIKVSYF